MFSVELENSDNYCCEQFTSTIRTWNRPFLSPSLSLFVYSLCNLYKRWHRDVVISKVYPVHSSSLEAPTGGASAFETVTQTAMIVHKEQWDPAIRLHVSLPFLEHFFSTVPQKKSQWLVYSLTICNNLKDPQFRL